MLAALLAIHYHLLLICCRLHNKPSPGLLSIESYPTGNMLFLIWYIYFQIWHGPPDADFRGDRKCHCRVLITNVFASPADLQISKENSLYEVLLLLVLFFSHSDVHDFGHLYS